MINPKTMKGFFKPHKFETKSFIDVFIESVGVKKFWKIHFEQECSKATDESCINTDCHYNYLRMHEDELYIEVMQEIQAERRAVEERTKRDMEKYFGTKQ